MERVGSNFGAIYELCSANVISLQIKTANVITNNLHQHAQQIHALITLLILQVASLTPSDTFSLDSLCRQYKEFYVKKFCRFCLYFCDVEPSLFTAFI